MDQTHLHVMAHKLWFSCISKYHKWNVYFTCFACRPMIYECIWHMSDKNTHTEIYLYFREEEKNYYANGKHIFKANESFKFKTELKKIKKIIFSHVYSSRFFFCWLVFYTLQFTFNRKKIITFHVEVTEK